MNNAARNTHIFKKNIYEAALNRAVKMTNVLLIVGLFSIAWFYFYVDDKFINFYEWGNIVVLFIYALIYFAYGRTYDAFHLRFSNKNESFYSQSLAIIMSDIIMYLIISLLDHGKSSILPMLGCCFIQVFATLVWCCFAHNWYDKCFSSAKAIILYNTVSGKENIINECGYDERLHVLKKIQVDDLLLETNQGLMVNDKECMRLQEADAVFLIDIPSHKRNKIIKYCINHNIVSYVQPRIGDILLSGARTVHMCYLPMMRVAGYSPVPEYVWGKRLFDFVSASMLFIFISPLFIMTALAVKISDGGPVFYKQIRLTQHGKLFKVLKFRSMRTDAEKDGIARLSTGDNDNRITSIGRFIRKCRLDELPQLINIIKGDMSVVGPRPERPEIAAEYEKNLPEFSLRLQGKAGLTGYAQVYGKYNTAPYDKLEMDLMYLANPSIVEDLRIIFATLKILFTSESTEGINKNQITAQKEYSKDIKR